MGYQKQIIMKKTNEQNFEIKNLEYSHIWGQPSLIYVVLVYQLVK